MNTSKKKQLGFTLIELSFVVVIIGILASIALPTYQDFVSRTQIHAAYQELSSLKNAVYLSSFRGDTSSSAEELGWVNGNSKFIKTSPTITINTSTGAIIVEATIDGSAQPLAKGVVIKLIYNNSGGWDCLIKKSNLSAWKDSLAPHQCTVTL